MGNFAPLKGYMIDTDAVGSMERKKREGYF